MNENINKALDDLQFAVSDLQEALKTASGVEGMVILRLIRDVANARTDLAVLAEHVRADGRR